MPQLAPRFEVYPVEVKKRTVCKYVRPERREDETDEEYNKRHKRFEFIEVEDPHVMYDVYFPSGHSIRVDGDELQRLGMNKPPEIVDLESGDVVMTQPTTLRELSQRKTQLPRQRGKVFSEREGAETLDQLKE